MFTNILTMGQVLAWIPSQSCMHLGTRAKGRFGACAGKVILFIIVDRLEKIEEATHDVFSALHIAYCLDSRPIWPLASRTSFDTMASLAIF